jgi:tetratricopeptide (TPR) repeat protein
LRRDDVLGRIAQQRGDHAQAQRYFIAADDVFAIGEEVDALAKRDPVAAYHVEQLFTQRLERTATHPDALAEAYWRSGVLASQIGRPGVAMAHYTRAVQLSPLSAKYLISAGFQAYDLHDNAGAQIYFQRAIAVDPGSADAYAGAGMTALRLGDRAAALMYAARSRRYDPHSHALSTLEQLLHG